MKSDVKDGITRDNTVQFSVERTKNDRVNSKPKNLRNVKEGRNKPTRVNDKDRISMVRTYYDTGMEDEIAFFSEDTIGN